MIKFRMWPVLATGFLVLGAGSYAIADDDDDDDDDDQTSNGWSSGWSSDWKDVWRHIREHHRRHNDDSVEILSCGQVVTSNAKLVANLDCPGLTGVVIGADDVTLDLNSFTITGSDLFGTGGVLSFGFDDLTIENGTISGFFIGVQVETAEDVEFKNLVIRDPSFAGISVRESSEVEIENVSLFGPSRDVGNTIAIQLAAVDEFEVDNVDVHGYRKGVRISCLLHPGCITADPARPNTDGKVTNSTFSGTMGVQVFTARDVKISGNHMTNCTIAVSGMGNSCRGITVAQSSEIEIENNQIHDNVEGGIILANNVTDSEISMNHVYNNGGNGIGLVGMGTGATGNEIESNITFGNGTDLFHSVPSSPNEWEDNSCETKDGDDIPDCSPP